MRSTIVGVAALAALLPGCDCASLNRSPHAGPDASSPKGGPDAAMAPAVDSGFFCTPVGIDAGISEAPLTVLADLCASELRGARNLRLATHTKCGAPYAAEDILHVDGDGLSGCSVGAQRLNLAQVEKWLGQGLVVYHADNTVACEQAGMQDGGVLYDDAGTMIAPCANILVGTVAVGGACEDNVECVPPAYCKGSSAATCSGTCTAPVVIGSACVPEADVCASGTVCRFGSGGYACQRLAAQGEYAQSDADCAPPLVLDPTTDTCQPGAVQGTACDSQVHCASGLSCLPSAVGSSQKICRVAPAVGEACGDDLDCAGSGCTTECNATTGRCEALGTAGAACGGSGNAWCAQGYFCGHGLCAVQARLGEPCEPDEDSCMWSETYCKASLGDPSHGTCARRPMLCDHCGYETGASAFCLEGYCNSSRAACVWFQQEGEKCDYGHPCEATLTCQMPDGGSTGTCAALPGQGAPCSSGGQCAPGSYCDESVSPYVCKQLIANGEPCTSLLECASGICSVADYRCHPLCQGDISELEGCGRTDASVGYLVFFAGLGLAAFRPRRRKTEPAGDRRN